MHLKFFPLVAVLSFPTLATAGPETPIKLSDLLGLRNLISMPLSAQLSDNRVVRSIVYECGGSPYIGANQMYIKAEYERPIDSSGFRCLLVSDCSREAYFFDCAEWDNH